MRSKPATPEEQYVPEKSDVRHLSVVALESVTWKKDVTTSEGIENGPHKLLYAEQKHLIDPRVPLVRRMHHMGLRALDREFHVDGHPCHQHDRSNQDGYSFPCRWRALAPILGLHQAVSP